MVEERLKMCDISDNEEIAFTNIFGYNFWIQE